MKRCFGCERLLPFEMFWRAGSYFQARCKECESQRRSDLRKADPEKAARKGRQYQLTRNGWSMDRYDAAIAVQDNCCAICLVEFTKTPHANHNHETGKPRGLLCNLCNQALGMFFEDEDIMLRAIAYLREYRD